MKLRKKIYYFICLVFLASIFSYFSNFSRHGNRIRNISLNGETINLEVVESSSKLQKGLGGRKGICEKCGMLFVFTKSGTHTFWMKDMLFPLDILWLKDGTIVHIEESVSEDFLGVLASRENADQVLELNAGSCKRLSLRIGDRVF